LTRLKLGKGRSGYSRSTLARLHGTLTRALDWGQARGLVTRNVSKLVVTPTGPRTERHALTVEEARRLLDAAAGDPAGPVIATGLLLGLRPGELIALRWEDVDLAAGTLTVNRYLKTRASRRTLRMPQRLTEILISHSAEQMTRQDASGLVFTSERGTAWDRANLRRALRRVAKAAGLPKMPVYELRHSMVSLLSAAGIPLEQIADVAGHSSPATTGSVYRHVVMPSIDAAAVVMDRELGD
jgi:integrase